MVNIDWGNYSNIAVTWLMSTGFWMVIVLGIVIVSVLGLYVRKRRGFDKNVLVLYDLSPVTYLADGKTIDWSKSLGIFDFETSQGGWFKHKWTLGGLLDYGKEKLFRLRDMTPVYDVSHNDYRKINGKNGIVVIRCARDPKFVITISKFTLSKSSKEAIAEIAPVDLRNAATNAIEQVDVEMQTKWEKWAPIVTIALVAMILIFGILLITQYGKHNIEQVTEIYKLALQRFGSDLPASTIAGASP